MGMLMNRDLNCITKRYMKARNRSFVISTKRWKDVNCRCNKAFVRKSDYTLHVNRNHSTSKPFPCTFPGCTHAYASRFELTRHQKVHSSYKELWMKEDVEMGMKVFVWNVKWQVGWGFGEYVMEWGNSKMSVNTI